MQYTIGNFVNLEGQSWEIADVDVSDKGEVGIVLISPRYTEEQANAGEEVPTMIVRDFSELTAV